MKTFLILSMLVASLFAGSQANASPIGNKAFEKVIYISSAINATKSAVNTGANYADAKGFWDGDLWAIPAGTVIENIFVIVDEALAGTTLFELGDDDDANDFIASSSAPLASLGMLYWDTLFKGNYLKGAAPVVAGVPIAKYYSAAGKELKLNVTTAASAGKARVVVRGYFASLFN